MNGLASLWPQAVCCSRTAFRCATDTVTHRRRGRNLLVPDRMANRASVVFYTWTHAVPTVSSLLRFDVPVATAEQCATTSRGEDGARRLFDTQDGMSSPKTGGFPCSCERYERWTRKVLDDRVITWSRMNRRERRLTRRRRVSQQDRDRSNASNEKVRYRSGFFATPIRPQNQKPTGPAAQEALTSPFTTGGVEWANSGGDSHRTLKHSRDLSSLREAT